MRISNAKIQMGLFVGLAVLIIAVILVPVGREARNWSPALSHDTYEYYYKEMEKLNAPEKQNLITAPFKVPLGTMAPDAAQAKPVFVTMLNLWHTGYKLLDGSLTFPDNQVYSDFIFFSLVLAFLSFAWLGWILGYPLPGLLASLIAFVNAWALTAVYFNSYTAISLSLLSIAFGLIYKKTPIGLVTSGALMAANVLVNQSVTVFLVSFAGLILFMPNAFRQRLYNLLYYSLGLAMAWGVVETIILAENIKTNWLYLPEYKVLLSYLNRSMTELSTYFSAYSNSLFPLILWKFSPVFSATVVISLVIAAVTLRIKGRAYFARPDAALIFVILLTLTLIDWRTGPKFSRTYFLLLPFVVLFTAISWHELWYKTETVRRWGRLLILCVLSLYIIECTKDLYNQRVAFLDVRSNILASFHGETPTYFFRNDTYSPFFLQLIEGKTPGPSAKMVERLIQDLCDPVIDNRLETVKVMVGPNVPSLINLSEFFTGTVDLPLNPEIKQNSGFCRDKSWTAVLEESSPFFSHYPFLILEDPRETFRLLKDRSIGWEDYRSGIGRVFTWKVTYETQRN